ncbi:unnamed protein product [Didymodactylos carnosus]|uniref:BZIP domain-containing protein n=1 Tax=Didymodactylos carnosus TaxID=1234261 RepID=A0A813QMN6_9BILA|nr:unnamed protein product [Didymodactylos carnosus]CAF1068883.1 unnamed protein product [Didymodactylos carnosus]CAF3552414.1 unnamed protein product [Didymodactylos carnosus]CAF3833507.1 unnamed protein product [Didymodactylos carnosus]
MSPSFVDYISLMENCFQSKQKRSLKAIEHDHLYEHKSENGVKKKQQFQQTLPSGIENSKNNLLSDITTVVTSTSDEKYEDFNRYLYKRQQNNLSSKYSRQTRKQKYDEMHRLSEQYEKLNDELEFKILITNKIIDELKFKLAQHLLP